MSRLATVIGGSGFVGRYVARRLAKRGFRVRVAVRRPEQAEFVKTYGHVGQVLPVFCNIRDDASMRAVLRSTDAVVNCVGTFDAKGRNNFQAVQDEGAARVARLAAEEGTRHLVQLSALGAGANAPSEYGRSKWRGEQAVLRHHPGAVILRPSVVFGTEDRFFNRFATMAARSPVLPVVGAGTRFQPVWVDDVAAAAEKGATGEARPGAYELGGPDAETFRELMDRMLRIIRRRRAVVNLPFWAANVMATVAGIGSTATFGLAPVPITKDQVAQLRADNVVAPAARGFADLGLTPTAMDAVLPDYLWRFRPGGQYAAMQESARNLRT